MNVTKIIGAISIGITRHYYKEIYISFHLKSVKNSIPVTTFQKLNKTEQAVQSQGCANEEMLSNASDN